MAVPWWYVDTGMIGAFSGAPGARAGRPATTAIVSGWSDSSCIRLSFMIR
jgi:hypothetical protein